MDAATGLTKGQRSTAIKFSIVSHVSFDTWKFWECIRPCLEHSPLKKKKKKKEKKEEEKAENWYKIQKGVPKKGSVSGRASQEA